MLAHRLQLMDFQVLMIGNAAHVMRSVNPLMEDLVNVA